ncbi:MAG: amidohydrolase family protein [Candidatus Aminicenantes bacterium]|nr:amidohydrolase family protein [Candidatus Aminicenantes bacterium]
MLRDFLPYIRNLKHKYGLKIVETHIHPFDVIGVVHYEDYSEVNPGEFLYKENLGRKEAKDTPGFVGWLGKVDYNKYAFFLFNMALRVIPGYENYDLKKAFRRTGVSKILEEMNEVLVDEAVLLPVEPWLPTEYVQKCFKHQRLRLLGSIDIHRLSLRNIKKTIKHFVEDYHIIGLKLHPNMQSFLPQPSHNPRDVEEKLRMIYGMADDLGLYLLFHGGPSGLARNLDKKYGGISQKSRNGILENYCDDSGRSELLGRYRIPIVIAHLGHFGSPVLNSSLARTILDSYDSVYFDTAGAPSHFIQKFIEWGGGERIFLGTDALYFRILYSMHSVYKAAQKARTEENPDDIMANILGRNYDQHILRRRENVQHKKHRID